MKVRKETPIQIAYAVYTKDAFRIGCGFLHPRDELLRDGGAVVVSEEIRGLDSELLRERAEEQGLIFDRVGVIGRLFRESEADEVAGHDPKALNESRPLRVEVER